MNPKIKTILLIVVPIFLILVWVVAFFTLTKKHSSQANILQSSSSSIQITDNTKTTSNISSSKNSSLASENIDNNQITVVLPQQFFGLKGENIGLKQIDSSINGGKINSSSKKNDKVNYQTFKTIGEYKTFLQKNITNLTGDIYLIPSIWMDDFLPQAQKFQIDENTINSFNYSANQILHDTQMGFLPYSMDLPIFLTQNIDQTLDSNPKIEDIKSILLLNKKPSSSLKNFVVDFGVDSSSLALLKKGISPFEGYENSLQIIFDIISKSQNIELLKSVFEFGDPKSIYQTYALNEITSWTNAYQKAKSDTFPECKTRRSLCLLQSNKTNIIYGFQSDLDISDVYFDIKPTVYPFFQSQGSPANMWFLMVKKDLDSTHLNLASNYIQKYMKLAFDGNGSFWNNTFSPVNSILDKQRYDSKFSNLLGNLGNIYIVTGSINSIQKIISQDEINNFFTDGSNASSALVQIQQNFGN